MTVSFTKLSEARTNRKNYLFATDCMCYNWELGRNLNLSKMVTEVLSGLLEKNDVNWIAHLSKGSNLETRHKNNGIVIVILVFAVAEQEIPFNDKGKWLGNKHKRWHDNLAYQKVSSLFIYINYFSSSFLTCTLYS